MEIWHDTVDAPRRPRRVSPSETMDVTGRHVADWRRAIGVGDMGGLAADGARREGATPAAWHHNDTVNSSWTAPLGPFAEGDEVTYTVQGASPNGEVHTPTFTFCVKPALYIAWLWHQHQPLYRDPNVADAAGSYRAPWVRLHALRDYYSMAALAAQHDVHVTFNLTPVLLRQIDDYLLHGATDVALDLTRRPSSRSAGRRSMTCCRPSSTPTGTTRSSSTRAIDSCSNSGCGRRDSRARTSATCRCGSNLAWFGHEFRTAAVRLTTGRRWTSLVRATAARVHPRGRPGDGRRAVQAPARRRPDHRALQEGGRIEVSTTPAFHPILPLLIDTDRACIDRPGPHAHHAMRIRRRRGAPRPRTIRLRHAVWSPAARALAGRGRGVRRRRRDGRGGRLCLAGHGCRRARAIRPVGLSSLRARGAVPTVPHGV